MVNQTRKCNLGDCYVTADRTMQNDNRTRVFLFYGTDVHASDVPLPRKGKIESSRELKLLYSRKLKLRVIRQTPGKEIDGGGGRGDQGGTTGA